VHLTPENLDNPAVTLNHDNLMALCEECHAEQHTKRRWRCDPNGHVRL
jgi:5-methylcytosine-specific restriction endonuclease McrA